MASNLTQRVAFAVVAIPAALAIVWQGGLLLAALLAVVAWLGTAELLRFARQLGLAAFAPLALVTAAAFPLLAWGTLTDPTVAGRVAAAWPYAVAVWLLVALLATLARVAPSARPLASTAVTLLAPLYAGALPAFLLAMRHSHFGSRSAAGTALVFFPLVTVWVVDSVAMTVGKRVGGPKFSPVVSPNKTWSGTIGGFVGGLALAPLYHLLVLQPLAVDVSPWHLLVIAAVLGVMGQLGDLTESLFKREVGFKDSSHLIPGHGGVLDRFDSLYFAIPLAATLYQIFGVI
jgi:phosphatidate cytidylyltransferase